MNFSSFYASDWWILVQAPWVTWPFMQICLLDSYSNTIFTTWPRAPLIILICFCHREQSYRGDEAWSYLYHWANDFTRWVVVKPLQFKGRGAALRTPTFHPSAQGSIRRFSALRCSQRSSLVFSFPLIINQYLDCLTMKTWYTVIMIDFWSKLAPTQILAPGFW